LTEGDDSGIRARGEEALSELAQAIAENPLVGGAMARALGAGERAAVAQRQAIGALNLASSSDFERLELRLRSFASRLEAIEDSMDQIRDDVAALKARDEAGRSSQPDA
jgi:chromosome segregation ATPase